MTLQQGDESLDHVMVTLLEVGAFYLDGEPSLTLFQEETASRRGSYYE